MQRNQKFILAGGVVLAFAMGTLLLFAWKLIGAARTIKADLAATSYPTKETMRALSRLRRVEPRFDPVSKEEIILYNLNDPEMMGVRTERFDTTARVVFPGSAYRTKAGVIPPGAIVRIMGHATTGKAPKVWIGGAPIRLWRLRLSDGAVEWSNTIGLSARRPAKTSVREIKATFFAPSRRYAYRDGVWRPDAD